jgi:hypothetical protein
MAALAPEGYQLQKDAMEAQNWMNAGNLVLQGARLGLDVADTVDRINKQGEYKDAQDFEQETKRLTAQNIEAGLQPISVGDGGEAKFEQYENVLALQAEYVEKTREKYGDKAAERAQSLVDGMNIDSYFNAAKMLNRDSVELTEANAARAAEKAVEAGDFGIVKEFLGTVADDYFRSQLEAQAQTQFNLGMGLKEAKGVYDTEGMDAAVRQIAAQDITDEQKKAMTSAVGNYAQQQTRSAVNTAQTVFDTAMEKTGGNIAASAEAARQTAEGSSPDNRAAVEKEVRTKQIEADDLYFEQNVRANIDTKSLAELKALAKAYSPEGARAADYAGLPGELNRRREWLLGKIAERENDIARAEKAAEAEAAKEGRAATAREKEDAVLTQNAINEWFYRWKRGEKGYEDGTPLLRVLEENQELFTPKQYNDMAASLVLGDDGSPSVTAAYKTMTNSFDGTLPPEILNGYNEALMEARLRGAKPEQLLDMVKTFTKEGTAQVLKDAQDGRTTKDEAARLVDAMNAGDIDALAFERHGYGGTTTEILIGGEPMKKAMNAVRTEFETLLETNGIEGAVPQIARGRDGDNKGYFTAKDKDGNEYRLGTTKGFGGKGRELTLMKKDGDKWVEVKKTISGGDGIITSYNKRGTVETAPAAGAGEGTGGIITSYNKMGTVDPYRKK